MKHSSYKHLIIFIFALNFISPEIKAQINPSSGSENEMYSNAPDFKWEIENHDFGKIPQGKPVTVTFKFTNTGTAPLVISSAKGSCECTKAEFLPAPVPPGKSGWVKATYDASKTGTFNRNVTITANTDGGPAQLQIKGEVLAKK